MADNAAFKANFAKVLQNAGKHVETVVRHSMLSLSAVVDERAPVDTGRFRANTNGAVGAIDTSTSYPPDKTGGAAKERLNVAVAAWKPGQTMYLTCSLPYAKVLEYGLYGKPPGSADGPKTVGGYSRQTPRGMFRLSVQEFAAIIKKEADKIK